MTVDGLTYLLLFYSILLSALSDDNTPSPKDSPGIRCDGGICVLKTTDTNFELPAELLETHIGPDIIIINLDEYHEDGFSIGLGVIAVKDTGNMDKLVSSILSKTATVKNEVYPTGRYFTKNINDSRDGTIIGIVNVPRPIPDPDTRFASLAQDPLLAGVPGGLRSELDPAVLIPSPTDGCDINKCIAIIPSADVFYFGPDPTNTACLPAITSPPPLPTLPQVEMDPSYVYVVYPGYQIFDGCRKWLWGDDTKITTSFRPDYLSTLQYVPGESPATKVLDFADLPCPPSDIAQVFDPKIPYSPILSPILLFDYRTLEGDHEDTRALCQAAAVRDPPVRARRVDHISGPNDGGDSVA
ncbi:MAG: hypothetical protein Q9168_005367 [Polycauliona sp. 1 TL-2023]